MAKSNLKEVSANDDSDVSYKKSSRQTVMENAANEFVFAVVGHVGSGTSQIAKSLKDLLTEAEFLSEKFDVEIIKARRVIENWADKVGEEIPKGKINIKDAERFQELGDQMRLRSKDYAAVAREMIFEIRNLRAQKVGAAPDSQDPILPDGKPRAYILDSIRHPAEVNLLRHIYQDAFVLIGVVCQEDIRKVRINNHYDDAGIGNSEKFMENDAKSGKKYGQRTSDAFHLADLFIDNSIERVSDDDGDERQSNLWDIPEILDRLIDIIIHREVVRPSISETAMYNAYGAQMRSACLSRQVGAALVDSSGNIVATGTNEVPKAGGGVYGESFENTSILSNDAGINAPSDESGKDHRCAFRSTVYCTSTKEQNQIIEKIIQDIDDCVIEDEQINNKLFDRLKDGRIGDLIEFSRAVHAEMDAILSASRAGVSPLGTRLFVTTFPCHYCARHIITSGIDEVQYIEPYPKSAACPLSKYLEQMDG